MALGSEDGKIWFGAGIDTSQLKSDADRTEQIFNHIGDTVDQQGSRMDEIFKNVAKSAVAIFSVEQAKEFARNIVDITGKMQDLNTSFKVMLGNNSAAASELMQSLIKLAATTPFSMTDVANGAKQLLAYGDNVENITDDLTRLGNISAGLTQPLGDIVYLYGTTMTQGRLFTADMRQFTGRGIPLMDELKKQFNASSDEISKMVTEGKIGFPEVQKAIRSMTSEGGKFAGLMEQTSKNFNGQISNIEDVWDQMLAKVGQDNSGMIQGVLTGVSSAIDNYQTFLNTIGDIVIMYGTYKAAVMVVTAIQSLQTLGVSSLTVAETIHYGWLVTIEKAQKILNATMLSNPYVLVATAVAGLCIALYKLHDSESYTADAAAAAKKEIADMKQATENNNAAISKYLPIARDANKSTNERKEAIAKLKSEMPQYFKNLTIENAKTYDVTRALEAQNNALKENVRLKKVQADSEFEGAKQEMKVFNDELANAKYTKDPGWYQAYSEVTRRYRMSKAAKDSYDEAWQEYKTPTQKSKITTATPTSATVKTKTKKGKSIGVNSVADAEQNYKDIIQKNAETMIQLQKTAERTVTDAKLSAMADGSDKVIAERKEANKRELQEFRDEKESYIKQREAMMKDEFEAEQNVKAKGNPKYKKQQWAGAAQSSAHSQAVNEANKLYDGGEAAIIAKQQLVEIEAARKSMRDYLQEYGTLQEKKLAIAQEYAEKIAAAQTEGDKKSLQAERDKKISSLNANQLAGNIDWSVSFKGVGNVLKDVAIETLNKVKDYMKTDEFRALPSDQKKPYLDLKTNLEQETGANSVSPFNFKIWGTISEQVKQYQQSVMDMKKAQDEHTAAVLEYQNAHNDLTNATDDTSKALAQKAVDAAKQDVDNTAAVQNDSEDRVNENKDNLKKSTEGAVKGLDNFKNALNNISSGSLYGFANGMTMLITSLSKGSNGIGKSLNELGGKIGGIIGAILQILDALGDDPNKFIDDLLQKLDQTISKIISDLPQIIITIVKDVANIVADVIGGIGSWFGLNIFGGADYSEYNAAKEKYTALLDVWGKLVDKKKEYLNESWGTEITKTAEEIKTLTDKSIAAYKEMGVDRLNSGASAGSHSIGVRQRNGMSDEGWAQLREYTNKYGLNYDSIAGGRMTGLFDLTTEQIANLQETAPSFWAQLDSDTKTYLQNIIDAGDSMEETMKKVKEQLLGVSQDSFVDNWLKGLDKLKSGSASIIAEMTSDFGDQMRQQIVDNLIMSKYQTQLKAFYEKWYKGASDASSAGGATVTKQEYEAFMKEYESMTTAAVNDVKGIYDAFGWSYNSATTSGTSASTVNASQDSVDMLTGRATSIDFHAERIENNTITISADVAAIKAAALADSEAITEMRNLSLQAVGHLEKISKNTNELYDIKTSIVNIERKVNNL